VHAPDWHVSPDVHAPPSLHAVPFGFGTAKHAPVAGLHAFDCWH
jgi:hypothetical protein